MKVTAGAQDALRQVRLGVLIVAASEVQLARIAHAREDSLAPRPVKGGLADKVHEPRVVPRVRVGGHRVAVLGEARACHYLCHLGLEGRRDGLQLLRR